MQENKIYTLDDTPRIADKLNQNQNVLFSYSPDEIDCYIVFIAPSFSILSEIPFGGDPHNRYMVSLLKIGCFHFNLNKPLFPAYVGEKFGLDNVSAEHVTTMLNGIGKYLR